MLYKLYYSEFGKIRTKISDTFLKKVRIFSMAQNKKSEISRGPENVQIVPRFKLISFHTNKNECFLLVLD